MPALIVSRNVLSDALSWMGAPEMHLRLVSPVLLSEENTSVQQAVMDFDRFHLHQWLKETPYADVYNRSTAFVAALQDCFCSDVTVISANYPRNTSVVRVCILLTVTQGNGR